MTRDEILKLPAGRKMDFAILYDVMGWKPVYVEGGSLFGVPGELDYWVDRDGKSRPLGTSPSADISAAWEVVKEMSAKNYWCVMEVLSSRSVVMFEDVKTRNKFQAVSDTYGLSLAICRAALLAKMDESGCRRMTAFRVANIAPDADVERLQYGSSVAAEKEAMAILKAQKRLLRLKKQNGNSWPKVEKKIGVNHGHMSALVLRGTVPRSKEIRRALFLPAVLPSERKPRGPKIVPLLGSPCWNCLAFKKLKPKKWKRQ